MNVRRARVNDAAAIATFLGEMGYTVTAEVTAKRLTDLPEGHAIFVADDGAELRGWIHLVLGFSLVSGPRVELGGLAVAARHQRAGVGGALLRRAEEWAAQRGATSVYVRSGAEREGAHRFYEGHGYTRLKTQFAFAKTL